MTSRAGADGSPGYMSSLPHTVRKGSPWGLTVPFRATTKKYKYSFRVFKEDPPVIELKTPLHDMYAYGATLSLPEVVVTNVSDDYTVEYFVSTPNGMMEALEEGASITLNSYGTYVLSVFVTDEHNVTFKKWTFKVEG